MTRGSLYWGMTIVGFVLPWGFLFNFISNGNATVSTFFALLFTNGVLSAVSADLLISALVFLLFVYYEGQQQKLKRLWLYPIATFGIGLSFALPHFLYSHHQAQEAEHD